MTIPTGSMVASVKKMGDGRNWTFIYPMFYQRAGLPILSGNEHRPYKFRHSTERFPMTRYYSKRSSHMAVNPSAHFYIIGLEK